MLRILRAFAWMRWRILVNSLERTGARDTLQRLSLAVEQLGPLMAAALFIPSAISLAALGGYAGYALAISTGGRVLPVELLRFLLFGAVALSAVGPIMLPASERTNPVRLLLLPISRATLYVAQCASALTDPWILLAVPCLVAFPAGLAAGGAFGTATVAVVGGTVLLIVLVGLSSLATTLLHLLFRNRRRGELVALVFVIVLPLVGLLPGLLDANERRDRLQARAGERQDAVTGWAVQTGRFALGLVPSELYRRSVLEGFERRAAWPPLLALSTIGATLHALGFLAFRGMLDSPASTGSRRTGARLPGSPVKVPGLSPGASAVAANQLRLAFRTPRGRSILVSPLIVFGMFALLMSRGGDAGLGFDFGGGLALATFSAATCVLAILPFAMNQFALDRSGLTLQLLAPLRDIDILIGKAVGNGLIVGLSGLVCVGLAFALVGGGHPALWLSIPLALASTYLLAAPAAAAVSAVLPRAVDLNSIGSRSNAHGLAGLVGVVIFGAASLPAILVMLLTTKLVDRPALAPAGLLVWCGLALLLCRLLLTPAARLFNQRRENLALVV